MSDCTSRRLFTHIGYNSEGEIIGFDRTWDDRLVAQFKHDRFVETRSELNWSVSQRIVTQGDIQDEVNLINSP